MQTENQDSMTSLVGAMTVQQLSEVVGLPVHQVVDRVWEDRPLGTSEPKRAQPNGAAKRKAASKVRQPSKTAEAPGAAKTKAIAQSWNTRTQEGREQLDAAILAALGGKDEPMRAAHVRRRVGGTAAQIRTRLNALIEAGKAAYAGRASATNYWRK